MEKIANKIVEFLDKDRTVWDDKGRMLMVLGFEVLLHNIIMIGAILATAEIFGIFTEAAILLAAYGALKMSAGGIHFKKSFTCLVGTGIFVVMGVVCSKHMYIGIVPVVIIYVICLVVLIIVGPQGTENNPIAKDDLKSMKKKSISLVVLYLTVTVIMVKCTGIIPYLLFIAVVFETLSLIPLCIKNRSL